MKKYFYSIFSLVLLLAGTGTANAAVGDVLTSLSEISNDKCYTITAPRGGLVLNSATTGICSANKGNKSTLDGADKWAILTLNGNSYYFVNMATKHFLCANNTMSTEPTNALELMLATNPTGNYVFKIKSGGNTLNNNNSGGFALDSWSTEDDGNRLTIVEAGDFDPSMFDTQITFTYKYKLDGNTIYQDNHTGYAGQTFPAPKSASYITAPTPSDKISNSTSSVDINCTSSAPFKFYPESTSFANISIWSFLKLNNKYVLYDPAVSANYCSLQSSKDDTKKENYAFAFIGNPYSGFRIVNRAAGESYTLSNPNSTYDGVTGANTFPFMKERSSLTIGTAEGNDVETFVIDQNGAGFFIGMHQYTGATKDLVRMNDRGKLAYWNGGDGSGSTFTVENTSFDLAETEITWIVLDSENNEVARETLSNCVQGQEYSPFMATYYPGVVLQHPTATANTEDQTIYTTFTVDNSKTFFQFSPDLDHVKWYQLKIREDKYCHFDGTNIVNGAAPESVSPADCFAFIGTPFGFKIYNGETGFDYSFGPATSQSGDLTKAPVAESATFVAEISCETGYENLKLIREVGNRTGYLNDVNGKLAYWNSTNNRHDSGSNFVFIEAPEDVSDIINSIDITYNIYLGDQLLGSQTITEVKGKTPTLDLSQYSSYVEITDMPATITSAQTTYNIHSSYKSTFPFSTDKWYNIAYRSTLNWYTTSDMTRIETQAVAKTTETWDNYMWRVEGNWYNGFRLYNKASDAYVSYGNTTNPANSFKAYLTNENETGSYFDYYTKDNNHYLIVKGSTNYAYVSNCGGPSTTYLTTWTSTGNIGDAGAKLSITECEELQDDDITLFTEALNAALATVGKLGNVPALYSSDAITTATNALNAIVCTTSSQVDAAILQIAPIINTLYASANGKMFAARSVHDTNHSYLSATNEGYVAATKTELKADVVFKLEYINNENKYYIKGLYNNVYVSSNLAWNNAVPTAEEAGSHKFIVGNLSSDASTSNQVYFATQLSGYNAVHFTTSYTDYHTCSWTYDAGASQWIIEAISDEQWETLSTTPNWEGLQNAINAASVYNDKLGNDLGQYNYMVLGVSQNENWEIMLNYYQNIVNAGTASASDVDSYITNVNNMISALEIVQPTPGSFLVIQGTTGSKYMNGRTLSSDPTVMWYGEDKKLVTYSTGLGFVNTSYDATVNDEFNTQTFAKAQTLGTYFIISNATGVGQYMYENTNNVDRYSTDAHDRKRWNVSYATSLPVTITSAGFATLYAPVALEIPSGVTAYVGNVENGSFKLTALDGIIPAKTGVILEGEANTYNFNITTSEAFDGDNTLTGTIPTIAKGETEVYTLQNGSDGVGLYKYTGENLNLKGFKAYLTLSSSSNGFSFVTGDELTGLNDATQTAKTGEYIDLLGNKVSNPQKGQIYILNGKLIKY